MKKNQLNECIKFQRLLPDFLSDNISEEDRIVCERHLKNCVLCRKQFEREENTLLSGNSDSNSGFKHLKIKFIKNIVISTICTLLAIIFIFGFLAPLGLAGLYHTRMEDTNRALKDYVQFTMPCAQIRSTNVYQGLLNMTGSIKYDLDIFRYQNPKYEINIVTPNLFGKPKLSKENHTDFLNYELIADENSQAVLSKWNKLEKVKEGTVAKIAIFFRDPISIDSVEETLQTNGEMEYIWFEIDAGNISSKYDILYPHWGFPGKYSNVSISRDSFENSANNFMNEMECFENISSLLGVKNIDSKVSNINKYIKSNGIKVKSIILHSSTSNILKLKENKEISNINIINIDFDY